MSMSFLLNIHLLRLNSAQLDFMVNLSNVSVLVKIYNGKIGEIGKIGKHLVSN